MPFLAAVKEAKLRTFVLARDEARSLTAKLLHDGSGYAMTKAAIDVDGKPICDARSPSGSWPSRTRAFRASMERGGERGSGSRWRRRPMAEAPRETWITGIGILSCLGEGPDAHWQALETDTGRRSRPTTFAPYIIHPLAPINFDAQIPKKGDQRQMEPWQRIGTYAAGLALDSAGAKGNTELLGRMDMIVAAGGGERDLGGRQRDSQRACPRPPNRSRFLNERLMSDLRPTLFLAQLSNLLAGNISIVHGVTGSSRTFMGEEVAGVDAVRIALARIESGQSDIALVGGAQNGERKDMLLLYEFGGYCLKGEFHPVWERAAHPGFALGSMGAFLVLESRDHAQRARRQADRPARRRRQCQSSRASPATSTATLGAMWDGVESHPRRRPARHFRRDRRRACDRRGARVSRRAIRTLRCAPPGPISATASSRNSR